MDLDEFFSVDGGGLDAVQDVDGVLSVAGSTGEMLNPRDLERALERENAQKMVECDDHCMFTYSQVSLCSIGLRVQFMVCGLWFVVDG